MEPDGRVVGAEVPAAVSLRYLTNTIELSPKVTKIILEQRKRKISWVTITITLPDHTIIKPDYIIRRRAHRILLSNSRRLCPPHTKVNSATPGASRPPTSPARPAPQTVKY
ncbi:hypothetical protein U1Q18_051102 [Sarracenia purpurea var. burkii]